MNQKGSALILITAVILLVVFGVGSYFLMKKPAASTQSSKSKTFNSFTNSQTVGSGNGSDKLGNPIGDDAAWETRNIYLHGLQVDVPSSWTLNESNKRPEPANANPKTGHDCADYVIFSNDDNALLYLKPACGPNEKIDDPPKNTAVLKDYGDLHIGLGSDQLTIQAKLFYGGSAGDKSKYQDTADRIVSSLKKI